MSVEPVRVVVLGAGRIGQHHVDNIRRTQTGLDVLAVADPVAEARLAVSTRFGVATMERWEDALALPSAEAVLICSPSDSHAAQIRAALDRGLHIFCEKPIASDLAGVDEVVDAVKRSGLLFQTGFQRRFDPSFTLLRQRIRDNAIGEVWTIRSVSRDPAPPPRDHLMHTGGLFTDTTIHDLDMIRFLSGAEIEEIFVFGDALVEPEIRDFTIDTAVISARLSDGVLATIENCRHSASGYDQRLEVHGSLGTAMAENQREHQVAIGTATGVQRAPQPHFFIDRYRSAYAAELAAFATAVRDGTEPQATAWDGRQALVCAIAAQRSLERRQPVVVSTVMG